MSKLTQMPKYVEIGRPGRFESAVRRRSVLVEQPSQYFALRMGRYVFFRVRKHAVCDPVDHLRHSVDL